MPGGGLTDGARRKGRILVVEDDRDVRQLVARVLAAAAFEVDTVEDALEAMSSLATGDHDLVVLDVGLPGVDGLGLLERIRRTSDVPVILLTGRSGQRDKINGLRSGADDYVLKPFAPDELVARVETVLRRTGRATAPTTDAPEPASRRLQFAGLEVDLDSREVHVAGRHVAMTAREFDLLAFLASAPRRVFSREQLLRQVWDSSTEWQDDATVTEHVRRVRRKIEADPQQPRWVLTIRGAGYRFEP
jgi:two-component system phosphate regulon response regulator PhoB